MGVNEMATCKDCEFGGSCVLLHKSDSQVCNIFTHKKDYVEVVRCKDCKYRGDDVHCPMRYEEKIEWHDDGYMEVDWITHDRTTDDGFCDRGERKGNAE
jgi:hypothetical protein